MKITGACCAGIPGVGTPIGTEHIDSNNIKYYITQPTTTNEIKNDKAIIIISDVFGYDSIHTRIIADRYANATQCKVYVPDVLKSQALPERLMIPLTGLMKGTLSFCQSVSAVCSLLYHFVIFASYNSSKTAEATVKLFSTSLKNSGVNGIASIGYCFGGDVSTSLGKLDDVVDCVCIAHAGGLKVPQDMKLLKKPACFILPHEDFAIKLPQIQILKEAMALRNDLQYEVLDYPKQLHGFACRGDDEDSEIKAAKDDALEKSSLFIKRILGI